MPMKPINSLINLEMLTDLATRSNFRYGKDMAKNYKITFIKSNVFNHLATVENRGPKETVELHSTPKGFRWKCTCSSKKNYFCPHCVAVCLSLIKTEENEE
jgi:uncharacterized Zn finger protein